MIGHLEVILVLTFFACVLAVMGSRCVGFIIGLLFEGLVDSVLPAYCHPTSDSIEYDDAYWGGEKWMRKIGLYLQLRPARQTTPVELVLVLDIV